MESGISGILILIMKERKGLYDLKRLFTAIHLLGLSGLFFLF